MTMIFFFYVSFLFWAQFERKTSPWIQYIGVLFLAPHVQLYLVLLQPIEQ